MAKSSRPQDHRIVAYERQLNPKDRFAWLTLVLGVMIGFITCLALGVQLDLSEVPPCL